MITRRFAAIAVLGCSAGAFAQLNYLDFSSLSGLNLTGSAVQLNSTIRLTPAVEWVAGNVWATTPQYVQYGFATDFTFRSFDGTPGNGADGMAFGIQANDANQVGDTGGNMSMEGIANAVTVVYRSFWNDVALWRTDSNGDRHVIAEVGFTGISRPEPWMGHIEYNGATHDWIIALDGSTILTTNYDVSQTVAFNSGHAYVGFGSSTGGQNDNNDLYSWQYASIVPEPGSMAVLAIAISALAAGRRRVIR